MADWSDPAGLSFQGLRRLPRGQRELALREIDDAADEITVKTRLYGFGRITDPMWMRFRRGYGQQRPEQSLRHVSLALLDVVNRLQDALDEGAGSRSAAANEGMDGSGLEAEDPTIGPAAGSGRREVEVQGMLVNGRLVVATNYNRSVTLLTQAVAALQSEARSEVAGPPLVRRLLDIQPGSSAGAETSASLTLPVARRVRRARRKLDQAYRGERSNSVTDAVRAADRVVQRQTPAARAARSIRCPWQFRGQDADRSGGGGTGRRAADVPAGRREPATGPRGGGRRAGRHSGTPAHPAHAGPPGPETDRRR
jgi:hypothetical protein